MNSFVVIAFFACMAVANAGLYHGSSAKIIQGPSSRTTVVGPEGSVISAVAPGGQIVHEEHPGVVAHSAPILAHAAPAVAYTSHSVAHHVPVVSHAVPAVAYSAHAAPVAYAAHAPSTIVAHSSSYEHGNTVVAGPSGTISTGHSAHGTPVTAYSGSVVAYGTHAAPLVAHAPAYAAYGHEGQYVHDNTESLYDDGSYKPHIYHH